jgi:hypothetical protein
VLRCSSTIVRLLDDSSGSESVRTAPSSPSNVFVPLNLTQMDEDAQDKSVRLQALEGDGVLHPVVEQEQIVAAAAPVLGADSEPLLSSSRRTIVEERRSTIQCSQGRFIYCKGNPKTEDKLTQACRGNPKYSLENSTRT